MRDDAMMIRISVKTTRKNAGILYKSLRRGKLFTSLFSLGGVKGTCMVAFLLLMALLRSLAQKAPEVKLFVQFLLQQTKITPRLKSLITFLE